MPTTISIYPGWYAAGLIRRVAGKRSGVDNGVVAESDVGGRERDPSGYDTGAMAEADITRQIGGDNAPWGSSNAEIASGPRS